MTWFLVCPVLGHVLPGRGCGGDGISLVVAVVAGQGGPAARPARVLRRRLRVFGGSPAAARRWLSSCRAVQAGTVISMV
jgi:hypothetical protein